MFRKREDSSGPQPTLDLLKSLGEGLSQRTPASLLTWALGQAVALAPVATRGYAVLCGEGELATIEAVLGYSRELLGLRLIGPWRSGGPRIVSNLPAELFQPNSEAARSALASAGLREVTSTLLLPLRDRGSLLGALVLDTYGAARFTSAQGESGAKLAVAVAAQLALLREYLSGQQLAWGLTRAIVEAIEAREFALLGHAQRVTSYAVSMGRELNLSVPELQELWFAAMLHDVGKLVNEGVDRSPGEHAQIGASLLGDLPPLQGARQAVRAHHERWDGRGVPLGLAGDQIPLAARIIAVCDLFDHLTSERGSRLRADEGLTRASEQSGSMLDPRLIASLGAVLRKGRSTSELAPESVFPS